MKTEMQLLDIVVLLNDYPNQDLRRGEVGTIVEKLASDVWLVEFNSCPIAYLLLWSMRAISLINNLFAYKHLAWRGT